MAVISGIGLNDKLQGNKQVKYFGGLRDKFNKSLTKLDTSFKGYVMPKWEDEKIWQSHYENDNKAIYSYENAKEGRKDVANGKELRDACFDIIIHADKNLDNCTPSGGWCQSCLMQNNWYGANYKD